MIVIILLVSCCLIILAAFIGYKAGRIIVSVERLDQNRRSSNLIDALQLWIIIFQNGKSINMYLREEGYKKAIIYGAASLGQLVLYELEKGGVEMPFFLDGKLGNYDKDRLKKPIYMLEEVDNMASDDLIIVTALNDYQIIKEKILNKCNCKVFSILELLNLCYSDKHIV